MHITLYFKNLAIQTQQCVTDKQMYLFMSLSNITMVSRDVIF